MVSVWGRVTDSGALASLLRIASSSCTVPSPIARIGCATVVSAGRTNDAASITGSSTGAVTEDGVLTATGSLAVSDADSGQSHFQTPASMAGSYGAFSFDAATGAWSYTLDNAAANVQALNGGQVVHDTLTVTSVDGTASQQIDVTITGSNDAASITGRAGALGRGAAAGGGTASSMASTSS